jgi:hypothetical protein
VRLCGAGRGVTLALPAFSVAPARSWSARLRHLLVTTIAAVTLCGCAELYPVAAWRTQRIPFPDRALLASPREPDCEGKPSASGGDSSSNDVLALRIKLEYDKECYRVAEMNMRERLKRLQASMAETVRALRRLERGDW